jgi:GAF domain-containing protein
VKSKSEQYGEVLGHIRSLIEGEKDEVAVLATMVAELHNALKHFHWTGFYRVTEPGILKVGPYQGGHGCLVIPFEKGVCGKCAREGRTQLVPDVRELPYHIACSSTTLSEIVVPVVDGGGRVRAVLDVDSNDLNAFDGTDQRWLEEICRLAGAVYI